MLAVGCYSELRTRASIRHVIIEDAGCDDEDENQIQHSRK